MADAVMRDEDLRLTDDDNVSNNMNGIKSEKLYDFLQTISTCKTNALNNFKDILPKELLPLLLEHLLVTIPNELFLKNSVQDQERLQIINSWMTEKFLKLDLFPFTILRICQLCYDPFKYFKINELTKFVNAIEKCCVVTSALDINDDKDPEVKNNDKTQKGSHKYNSAKANNNSDDNNTSITDSGNNDEDVSLVKIPWIDEVEADPEFPQFLKDIDSIMSVNFGYDDGEDDEDEDMEGSHVSMENDNDIMMANNSDVMVEEYYENDGDNEADLDTYSGLNDSNVNVADKEIDIEDDDDEDYNENASDNASDDDDEEDEDEKEDNHASHQEVDDEPPVQGDQVQTNDDSKTPRKRKPTELDIFDYNDNSTVNSNNELTTPKKHKQDDSTLVIESPVITTTLEGRSNSNTSDKQDTNDADISLQSNTITGKKIIVNDANTTTTIATGTSMLYSPRDENVINVNTEKIRAITDINETSPLGNKTR